MRNRIIAEILRMPVRPSMLMDIAPRGLLPPWHMPIVQIRLLNVDQSKYPAPRVYHDFNYEVKVFNSERKLDLVKIISLN